MHFHLSHHTGYTYGGSGSTFKIPDLTGGRVILGAGLGPDGVIYTLGQTGGTVLPVLNSTQLPAHTHDIPSLGTTGR